MKARGARRGQLVSGAVGVQRGCLWRLRGLGPRLGVVRGDVRGGRRRLRRGLAGVRAGTSVEHLACVHVWPREGGERLALRARRRAARWASSVASPSSLGKRIGEGLGLAVPCQCVHALDTVDIDLSWVL